MPLNPIQKLNIEQTIEHLLSLPEDSKELVSAAAKLKDIFTPPFESTHPEYIDLQKCIQRPADYFHNLEKRNTEGENITLGEVQIHLLDYVSVQLQKAAAESKVAFAHLKWNQKELFDTLVKLPSCHTRFESSPIHEDERHPYTFDPADSLFNFSFEPIVLIGSNHPPQTLRLSLNVNVLPPVEKKYKLYLDSLLDKLPPELADHPDLDQTLRSAEFAEVITDKARSLAAEIVLQNLVDSLVIAPEAKEVATFGARELITHPHYYMALIEKTLPFKSIIGITTRQAEILTYPSIISFIQSKQCTLEEILALSLEQAKTLNSPGILALMEAKKFSLQEAKTFSPPVRKVICTPYYQSLLTQGKLELKDIKDLKTQQCYTLTLPAIINLQMLNKIKFYKAKNILSFTQNVLTEEFYYNQISKGQLDFSEVSNLTASQQEKLLSKPIMRLISQKILAVRDAKNLPYRVRDMLQDPYIFKLVENNLIKPLELYRLHADPMIPQQNLTKIFPCIKNYSVLGTKKFKSLLQEFSKLSNFYMLYTNDLPILCEHFSEMEYFSILQHPHILLRCERNLAARINAILNSQPIKIRLVKNDSLKDIEDCCQHFSIDFIKIRDAALNTFIKESLEENRNDFIKNAQQLNLTLTDILSRVMGIRLLAIYHNQHYFIKNETDSLSLVKNDIDELAKEYDLASEPIRNHAIKYLLQGIKLDLQKTMDISAVGTSEIYKKVHQAILYGEISDAKASDLNKTTWGKTLVSIGSVIESNFVKKSPAYTDHVLQGPPKKPSRLNHSFYSPTISRDSFAGIKNFCKTMESFKELVSPGDPALVLKI